MSAAYDVVVIGAGHNGLVTAAYLAKAGRRVLVLERRDVVGGATTTEEIFPGYRVDTGAHRIGGLSRRVIGDLGLAAHGLTLVAADPSVVTPVEGGPALVLWRDTQRTVEALRATSPSDAGAWMGFTRLVHKASSLLDAVWHTTPPDVTGTDLGDLWSALKLGRRLRGLGKKDMVEVMRILPMSMYELLDEWFESDLIRGTLAASAIAGLRQGPMSAGTAYMLLHHHVGAPEGAIRPTVRVRGGMGRLADALLEACRAAGADVRTSAPVERITVTNGTADGVVLSDGEEIRAAKVVSALDPHRTLALLDPAVLPVEFVRKVDNIRFRGVTAKVHLALGALPDFVGLANSELLRGVVSISPSFEYVERAYDDAKYGRVSAAPYLEVTLPSVADPEIAPTGKHLASIVMQYAPYTLREGTWDATAREALGDLVVATLERWAPGIGACIEDRHVLTPADLEERFALTEGNIYHGEMTLDQLLFMRPVPGASRYRSPVAGLYLCSAGTHPGGGVTGVPGANAAREILKDR